jgi:hypothetical protein
MAALLMLGPVLYAQTDLGIGVVSVNFDEKTVIHFYEKPNSDAPTQTIRFFNDESIRSWNIEDLDAVRKWLAPESLWLDYNSFVFRCRARQAGWLQVIVNNNTGKSYWVKASPVLQFQTWETFLKGMFSVARSKEFPQKILVSPAAGSREVRYRRRDCFDVMSMRGDWIQVTQAGHCENPDKRFRSGWIRWRRGRTLLIEYFITS